MSVLGLDGTSPSLPLQKVHILMLSFPTQGHVTPLLQLSRKLVHRGFLVTFVIPERISARSPRSDQDTQAGPFAYEDSLKISIVAVPDGFPSGHLDRGFQDLHKAMEGMRKPVEDLIRQVRNESVSFTCIISDLFVTWSYEVASHFQTDWVAFFSTNANCCAVVSHARELVSNGVLPFHARDGLSNNYITAIPGVPPLRPSDFPPTMQNEDLSHYRFQFTLKLFEHIRQSSGLILNTFYELESRVIDALQEDGPVYPVGPLLLPSSDEAFCMQPEVSFWQEDDRCLAWLDTQPPASVVYVSFGSISIISEAQIQELALGLEASQQRFLWVIRPDAVCGPASNILPEGFLNRTRDRGLIISWAPQLHVLAHSGIGAFLSHCGWNSTLENISIGGVPMLCFPDHSDQKLNCRLLVDEWKIGMELQTDEDGTIHRTEVQRVVRAVTQGEEGREMATRARELKNLARSAMKETGSSVTTLNHFMESRKARLPWGSVKGSTKQQQAFLTKKRS